MSALSTSGMMAVNLFADINIGRTLDAIKNAVDHPAQNTSLLLIVIAWVVIAVLIFAVFALMLLTPSTKRVVKRRTYVGPRPEGTGEPELAAVPPIPAKRPLGRVFLALTGPLAVGIMVTAALAGSYVATGTDTYCALTCHAGSSESKAAQKTDHAGCVSCHEAGPVTGLVQNSITRIRMAVGYSLGASPASATVSADSRACLRCHGAVRTKTVRSAAGLRMSHKEVIAAGQPCTVCHAQAGHVAARYTGTMATCLPCHNGVTASAQCVTCHLRNPTAVAVASAPAGKKFGSGKYEYPAVRAANRDCSGCHNQAKSCDPCHGIRMPHSLGFIAGSHARPAAFRGKLQCWKCHDPQFCGRSGCHRSAFLAETGDTTHGSQWKTQHQIDDWNAGCVCHSGRSKRKAPICTLCHDPKTYRLLPIRQ